MSHNWDYYTNITDDQFIENLDLSDRSKEQLTDLLQKVAEKAYEQGQEDEAAKHDD